MGKQESYHWADITADKIIREKGPKEVYTCASGITPSGTVHIGNFREIISVELVARALREKGQKVRFIYSWDDYDVFRKVPVNMPEPELLETYLRQPITLVPDTTGEEENYARRNEVAVEKLLPTVGVNPEYLYQASRYRSNKYAEGIRTALQHKEEIKEILNEFRTAPLSEDWWPISVFSSFTKRDNTKVTGWDGEWTITYKDLETEKEESLDIRNTPNTKLPWRVDWPMRWVEEGVDFEPAGKDHHSQGGSFDTSRRVVELFGGKAPVSFKYDFIGVKGRGGKMSSSGGNVISLSDVLEVYTPEVCRFMFAGTRPNAEFSFSFDLDVLKIYEDYDHCERVYFGIDTVNDKKKAKLSRIYELSQVNEVPNVPGYQIAFRHLCNQLLINTGNIDETIASLEDVKPEQVDRLKAKCICAWNWLKDFAPEDFKYSLTDVSEPVLQLSENQLKAIRLLVVDTEKLDEYNEKEFAQCLYDIAEKAEIDPKEFFELVYHVIINRDKGPKLAGFIKTCGKKKILPILKRY